MRKSTKIIWTFVFLVREIFCCFRCFWTIWTISVRSFFNIEGISISDDRIDVSDTMKTEAFFCDFKSSQVLIIFDCQKSTWDSQVFIKSSFDLKINRFVYSFFFFLDTTVQSHKRWILTDKLSSIKMSKSILHWSASIVH